MADLEIEYSYCYDLVEEIAENIEARIVAHFRPSSDWKGKGYGFDWMRCGDYLQIVNKVGGDPKYAEGDIPYEQIVGDNFDEHTGMLAVAGDQHKGLVFKPNPQSYKTLEREYKPMQILTSAGRDEKGNNETYHCSWLSIFPTKKVTLSLVIDVKKRGRYTRKARIWI